jgi:3D (Asp-Asp-Asp) domain-containing protein
MIEIEGYGYCLVLDRTSTEYAHRVDVAFKKTETREALNWGVKRLKVW